MNSIITYISDIKKITIIYSESIMKQISYHNHQLKNKNMKTKLLLNDLLYIEEHLSCRTYAENIKIGFRYIEFDEEQIIEEEYANRNYLLFLLKGKFTINCNHFCNRIFNGGQMVLLPKSSMVKLSTEQNSKILTLAFDVPQSSCDKLVFQSLTAICDNMQYDFNAIQIRDPLLPFIETLVYCLKNGMNCMHLHDIMQREFFFLLRGFYEKKEIAMLFHPIIGKELAFKDFIMQNYTEVNHLDELIALSNMGRTSFFIKFKEEFGVTAKQWMMKQLKKRILGKVMEPGVCVKQLMEVCNFESQAQLYRYFKQQFHCTPKQLIDRYQPEY